MKIRYEFVTGEVVEIEAGEDLGTWILEHRRKEESYNRKQRRQCYSLDLIGDHSLWDRSPQPDPLTLLERMETERDQARKIHGVFESLTEKQKALIRAMCEEGFTEEE